MSGINADRLLAQLRHAATKSDCDKIKFGAAALDTNGDVLAFGWNHNPTRTLAFSCATDCVGGIRKGVKSGTCVERCYAIHAEQHAILQSEGSCSEIAVVGLLPDGALFDNGGGFYCTVCARIMCAAGVKTVRIWANENWRQISIADALSQSYGMLAP